MSAWHVSDALLDRFASIEEPDSRPKLWSAEAHLEHCPQCRARLRAAMETRSPELLALVESVHGAVGARVAALPAPARSRRRLTGGLLVSRLMACVAVLLVAALLDLAADAGATSWVLLVAPVLPLAGVAASWSRALDPAYDLVAATPAAGLSLLLWRTIVVLAVVVPTALLAGAVTGAGGLAAWLLPCLALTTVTLALGSATDLARAAAVTAGAWALGVVVPALAAHSAPAAFEPAWLPAWGTLAIVALAVTAVRRQAYRRPAG